MPSTLKSFFGRRVWAGPSQLSLLQHVLELKPFAPEELSRLNTLFRTYVRVGGIPAVVRRYLETGSLEAAAKEQRVCLKAVRDSVRWFPAGAEQRRSLAVIDEVPRQLQNRNKQFAVSGIGPHARRRDYMGVVERLTDAGTADLRQPRSRADESLFPRYRSFGDSNERARPRILCRRRLRQGLRLTRRC